MSRKAAVPRKERSLYLWAGGAALLVYLILLGRVFLLPALTVDETSYIRIAKLQILDQGFAARGFFGNWLVQRNHLGYGALFWNLLATLIADWPRYFEKLRWATLAGYGLIAGLILAVGWTRRNEKIAFFALLIWLTHPLAWWCGKVSGVESCAMVFGALGLFCLYGPVFRGRLEAAMTAFGVAAGLKITSISNPVFGGVYALATWRTRPLWRTLVAVTVFPLLGLILANPYSALNPREFLGTIFVFSAPVQNLGEHLDFIFFGKLYQLDLVLDGGFFTLGTGAFAWLCLLGAGWYGKLRKEAWLPFAAAFLAMTFTLARTDRFYCWYWFSTLIFTPFVFTQLTPTPRALRWLGAAVIAGFLFSVALIASERELRFQNAENLARAGDVQQCLKGLLAGRKYDQVFDLTEVGRIDSLEIGESMIDHGFFDPYVTDPARRPTVGGYDALFAFWTPEWRRQGTIPSGASSALILVGDRIASSGLFGRPEHLSAMLKRQNGEDWRVDAPFGRCLFVSLMEARR